MHRLICQTLIFFASLQKPSISRVSTFHYLLQHLSRHNTAIQSKQKHISTHACNYKTLQAQLLITCASLLCDQKEEQREIKQRYERQSPGITSHYLHVLRMEAIAVSVCPKIEAAMAYPIWPTYRALLRITFYNFLWLWSFTCNRP